MDKPEMKIYNGFNHIAKDEKVLHYLQLIEQRMECELGAKQKTIERQEEELLHLRNELAAHKKTICDQEIKMQEAIRTAEGNRQLVNKLLNDMERLQQDIGWYKRTYESRSIGGTIKEKISKIFK